MHREDAQSACDLKCHPGLPLLSNVILIRWSLASCFLNFKVISLAISLLAVIFILNIRWREGLEASLWVCRQLSPRQLGAGCTWLWRSNPHWFEGIWGRQVERSAWGSRLHFIQYKLFWASVPLESPASAPTSLPAHWPGSPSPFLAQLVLLFPARAAGCSALMAEGQCPKAWATEYTRKVSYSLSRVLTDGGLESPSLVRCASDTPECLRAIPSTGREQVAQDWSPLASEAV